MKKLSRIFLVLLLAAGSWFGFASASHANDIVPGSALEKEMKEMIDRGILTGYTDGSYRPQQNVTREQFAAFISRALNLPAGSHAFTDVNPNTALGREVGKVYAAGIMDGLSRDRFAPNALITREQVAMTIENVLEYSQMELQPKRVNFTDSDDMSSVVLSALYNIANYQIVNGYPDNSFKPKANATREQAAAFIYRFLMAKEQAEETPETPEETPESPEAAPEEPKEPVEPAPSPPLAVDENYYIAFVEKGELVKQSTKYETYAAAAANFENDVSAKAIMIGDEIIRIKSGIAYGDATLTTVVNGKTVSEVTTVYYDTGFSKSQQATYIEPGREMLYLNATDEYVKVQIAGTIGYVKQSEVELVPEELVTGRDYYEKKAGNLLHHLYNHAGHKQEFHYSIGPAPKEMKEGEKYYSLDGVHFEDADGTTQITHYPYFQYQSVRTKTSYTAEELDHYILQQLEELGKAEDSKLVGMGEFFIEKQEQHNINALFLLAAAMHESDYGTSLKAHELNNLYGIEVYDNQTEKGKKYDTPQESIEDFAGAYMNRDYADTLALGYYNGAAPGNKTTGINVMYASDPAWGSKVAGHMYRADAALGRKDLNKYQLGISNTPRAYVRPSADLTRYLYYFGRLNIGIDNAFGYPVVILGEEIGSNGELWYKVITDLKAEDDKYNGIGWIQADVINKIN